jgi:spore maturation protein SpmB
MSATALTAGLPSSSIPALLAAFSSGTGFREVPGMNEGILSAALRESHLLYARAYRLAWASIIPFVVLALVAIVFLKGVRELMTEKIEATVERDEVSEKGVA